MSTSAQDTRQGTQLLRQEGRLDAAQRRAVAVELLQLARVYDATLPVLTPSEREYVEQEEAYLGSDRIAVVDGVGGGVGLARTGRCPRLPMCTTFTSGR